MIRSLLHKTKQALYHTFRLYPVYRILARINARFPLKGCHALEAFAFTGALQARAYKQYPAYHEAWEISGDCREPLKKNLPGAVIKITNSFSEVLTCSHKFNFINVDTHQGLFGDYCENFEFFPLLFRVAQDECIVNLNVIPHAGEDWKKRYPDLFNAEHLARRKAFYGAPDPANVSFEQMLAAYSRIAGEHGYEITWHAVEQRTLTYYLALHLKKKV